MSREGKEERKGEEGGGSGEVEMREGRMGEGDGQRGKEERGMGRGERGKLRAKEWRNMSWKMATLAILLSHRICNFF
jgi:hypothetical protein